MDRTIFAGPQHGRIDRCMFTADANGEFDAAALNALRIDLAPLGQPQSFGLTSGPGKG